MPQNAPKNTVFTNNGAFVYLLRFKCTSYCQLKGYKNDTNAPFDGWGIGTLIPNLPKSIKFNDLNKGALSRLSKQTESAKAKGLSPEEYARQLIEDALALQQEAEAMSIEHIMAPVRQASGIVDEAEILNLVDKARNDYHGGTGLSEKR